MQDHSVAMSESVAALAKALIAAQADLPELLKNRLAKGEKFSYTYVGLETVMPAALKALNAQSLGLLQTVGTNATGATTLTTMLLHESGEWVSDTQTLLLTKNDPQGQGSAITYGRRYAVMSLLGLVAEADDDARSTVPRQAPARPAPNDNEENGRREVPIRAGSAAQRKFWAVASELGFKGPRQDAVYAYLGIPKDAESGHPLTEHWLEPAKLMGLTADEAYTIAEVQLTAVYAEAGRLAAEGAQRPGAAAVATIDPLGQLKEAARVKREPAEEPT